jgi:diacylglycerol kinase family enzyme
MPVLAHTDPPAKLQGPVAVLLNSDSGAAARLDAEEARRRIVAAFAQHGIAVELAVVPGRALRRAVRRGLKHGTSHGPVGAIVAAGGDGTINALAQELAGTGVALGILPLGTVNHFARDLGLPVNLAEAVAVVAHGHTVDVDVAEVNGQVFVNNSSIGLYPEMVRDRERQRRRTRRRKLVAMALAALRVLRHPRVRHLQIETDGQVQPRKVPFVFVGNNVYGTDLFSLARRATLRGGQLCLYTAGSRGFLGLVRLLFRAALGRLDETDDVERRCLDELVIRSRRHRLKVSLDGEVVVMHQPLHYRIRPHALRVLAPEPASPR